MKPTPSISRSEWEVLSALWQGHPASTAELMERLESTGWKMSTVKTFLDRLVKKQVIGFEVRAGRYFYHPLVSRESCVEAESSTFLSRIFRGKEVPMLMQFVQNTELSASDIAELTAILKQKQAEAGRDAP